MSDECAVITTTIDTQAGAERLAHALVERRLAACVQIDGPIRSVYRWNGAIEDAQEWRCSIKTRAALAGAVARAIAELHSYDLPEIVVMPVSGGSAGYLGWIVSETQAEM